MIAGVDCSSRAVDMVLLDDEGEQASWHRFALEGGTPFERARNVPLAVVPPAAAVWDDVWLLGLEDPRGPHVHSVKAQAVVIGALLAWLPANLVVLPMIVQEWKRVFTGSPSATKEAVRHHGWLCGFRPYDEETPQDAFDAYGIAWAARAINQQAVDSASA